MQKVDGSAAGDQPADMPPGLGERIAFSAVPLWLVALIVLAGLVCTVLYESLLIDTRRDDSLAHAGRALAQVPQTIRQAIRELHYRPAIGGKYPRLAGGLWRNPKDPFVDDGYVLLTSFDAEKSRRVVNLLRLRDGVVVHSWAPDIGAIHAKSSFRSAMVDLARDKSNRHYFPMHPMLTADGGLVIHDTSPLVKVDTCGRLQWMVDGIFHHSLERDGEGNLWAAYRWPRSLRPGVGPEFKEDAIVRLTPEGHRLYQESIIDILDRNGLGYLWRSRPYRDDPIHLNEIQPVLRDGPYWKRGDVFLSLRNLSMLMLYRPATGRVIWHDERLSKFQHDVEIVDDHRITAFDNNWTFDWRTEEQGAVDGTNRVIEYDFATGEVRQPLEPGLHRLGLRTVAQGRATTLPNGDVMLEETEHGRLMRVTPSGALRWQYIEADAERRRYELRWSRYVDPVLDRQAIEAVMRARCN